MGKIFLGILSIAFSFLAFSNSLDYERGYDRGVLDTVKLLQNQPDIKVPQTPYWLLIDATEWGKGRIILTMARLQRNLFTPVLIWYNGSKYIVVAGDVDPNHLRELKRTSNLKNAFIAERKNFEGYRKLYISLSKECNYPIYTLNTLLFALEKKVSTEVSNPRKKQRILMLIEQIKEELKPTSEGEIWKLLSP